MIYKYLNDINTFDDFADIIANFRKTQDYYDNIKIKIYQDNDNMLLDSFIIDKIYIDIVDAYNNIISYADAEETIYFVIDKK